MDIKEIVSNKLKKIWDNSEFYKNIFNLFDNEQQILELNEYLSQNNNVTSDDVFVKVFEICKLDVYKNDKLDFIKKR